MKMHTFFLSGKAIAIVSGAIGLTGALLFVSGLLVGVKVQIDAGPASANQARTGTPALAPTPVAAIPGAGAGSPPSAAPGATGLPGSSDAAWPFSASSYAPPSSAATEPAPTPPAVPLAPPRANPIRQTTTTARISMTAYNPAGEAAPSERPATSEPRSAADASSYLVQVGTFRVEQHARDLAARLTAAGYRSTVTLRQDGDRALHVVRVGQFAGLEAAEQVAAKIGGREQLVAYVVPVPARQ